MIAYRQSEKTATNETTFEPPLVLERKACALIGGPSDHTTLTRAQVESGLVEKKIL